MQRRSNEKDKSDGDYILVKFIEDNIWFVSSKVRVRKSEDGHEAKWAPDGKWYKVEVHSQGDKASMTQLLYQNTRGQIDDNHEDNTKVLTKSSWRRMCNVSLDTSKEMNVNNSSENTIIMNQFLTEKYAEKFDPQTPRSRHKSSQKVLEDISNTFLDKIDDAASTEIPNYSPDNRNNIDIVTKTNEYFVAKPLPDESLNVCDYSINQGVENAMNILDKGTGKIEPHTGDLLLPTSQSISLGINSSVSTISEEVSITELSNVSKEMNVNNYSENTIITNRFLTEKYAEKFDPQTPQSRHKSPQKVLEDISNTFLDKIDDAASTEIPNHSPDNQNNIDIVSNTNESFLAKPFSDESLIVCDYSINQGVENAMNILEKETGKIEPHTGDLLLPTSQSVSFGINSSVSTISEEVSMTELSNVSTDSEIIIHPLKKTEKDKTNTDDGFRILPDRAKKTCISYSFNYPDCVSEDDPEDPFAHIDSSDGYQPSTSETDTSKISNISLSSLTTRECTPVENMNYENLEKGNTDAEINFNKEVSGVSQIIENITIACNVENNGVPEGTNDQGEAGVFIDDVQVAHLSGDKNCKRKWDKRFYCVYCGKYFAKLPRHWYRKHSKEPEVAKITSLDKTSTERKELITALQNRSTFKSNSNAMRAGVGTVVPKRRHRESEASLKNYTPCEYCYQLFSKAYVSRHQRACKFKTKSENIGNKRKSVRAKNFLMLPVGPQTCQKFKDEILSKMSGDDIFIAIRNDPTILKYGETEFRRLGHDIRYNRTIADRCRELGRLLIKAKELNPNIIYLRQLINANNYQLFKRSVLEVSEFDDNTNTFGIPSVALKIGMTMRKIATMLKGDCLEDEILTLQIPQLDSFLEIMNSKWSTDVTSHAYRTLNERKWNQPKRLPLARDIQKLNTYLLTRAKSLYSSLQMQPDINAFKELTEIALVMTIILNRRRVGEVQYMKFADYEKAKTADADSDVFGILTDAEKQLSKSLVRLVVRGKKGRGVPVLMTATLQLYVSELIKLRIRCGVLPTNPYLFPSLRHTSGFYPAHKLINQFSVNAGCEAPQNITSTKLRKHIAIMVQLLNLKENELDSLAQFMGHDIRVHRQFYRLQDETVQLAKISKILINMEKGNLNIMKGKTLDEIEVNEEITDNEDSEEEDLELTSDLPDLSAAGTLTYDFPTSSVSTSVINVSSNDHPQPHKAPLKRTKENTGKVGTTPKSKVQNKKNREKADKIINRKKWCESEKKLTLKYFARFINMQKVPNMKEINMFLEKNPIIQGRTWRNVKDVVYNEIKKQKKMSN